MRCGFSESSILSAKEHGGVLHTSFDLPRGAKRQDSRQSLHL